MTSGVVDTFSVHRIMCLYQVQRTDYPREETPMTITRKPLLAALLLLAAAGTATAGTLDAPALPSSGASALYTVNDLYNRLTTGAAGAKRSGPFAEPAATPGPVGHTIDEIMAVMPTADNATGAPADAVFSGKTFWGLRTDGTWGMHIGTITTQVLNPASTAVPAGTYTATDLATVDPDLATVNIRAGVSIFGVTGNPNVVNTGTGTAETGDMLAGKKAWVAGTEVTGTMPSQTLNPASTVVPAGYFTATDLATVDTDLASGNIRAGVTVFGVTGNPNVANTSSGTAVTGDMLAGKKAWVAGTEVTGTMPLQTLNPDSNVVPAGYYAATNLAAVDPDLATANIKAGITIFGTAGDPNVVNTGSGTAAAADILLGKTAWVTGAEVAGIWILYPFPVGKTGQTSSSQTGDDGDWHKGVAPPEPRFIDNLNGTVTDNATGLIWLKNASCFGGDSGAQNWAPALTSANTLASGACGLTDGSTAGQWRLPNVKELQSLFDYSRLNPALPSGHPFSGVKNTSYWTSTPYEGDPGRLYVWLVNLSSGGSGYYPPGFAMCVWPVRGGQ